MVDYHLCVIVAGILSRFQQRMRCTRVFLRWHTLPHNLQSDYCQLTAGQEEAALCALLRLSNEKTEHNHHNP